MDLLQLALNFTCFDCFAIFALKLLASKLFLVSSIWCFNVVNPLLVFQNILAIFIKRFVSLSSTCRRIEHSINLNEFREQGIDLPEVGLN